MPQRKKIIWHKVTWYSKLLAVILFVIVIPGWAFFMGTQYQRVAGELRDFTKQSQDTVRQYVNQKTGMIKTFASKELGISFKYSPLNGKIAVKEVGPRVYVYPTQNKPEEGQFVEVFTKDKDQSFTAAIQEKILKDYPSKQCTIVVDITQPYALDRRGYHLADIVYPEPSDETLTWTDNAKLCNPEYAQTNGVRYFLYYPARPTQFYFFSIGQNAIKAGDKTWQQTFSFIQ